MATWINKVFDEKRINSTSQRYSKYKNNTGHPPCPVGDGVGRWAMMIMMMMAPGKKS